MPKHMRHISPLSHHLKLSALLPTALTLSLSHHAAPHSAHAAPPPAPTLPTDRPLESADAQWFIAQVNRDLRAVYIASSEAQWANSTHITPQHEAAAAAASEEAMAYVASVVPLAAQLDAVHTDPTTRRQLTLLKRSIVLPAPSDPARRARLAQVATELEARYGKGEHCATPKGGGAPVCRDLEQLEEVMRTSRDPAALRDAWEGWREATAPTRDLYAELVTLGNEGARSLNFRDMGDLWRSQYDMTPAEFEADLSRLWGQVKPLYDALHCHVRAALNQQYGDAEVPLDAPIPAHLTGNMWAQDWVYLYDLVVPAPNQPSLDVTAALKAQGYTPKSLTKLAEDFFVSLGFSPLPPTFWERSLFEKPTDREVVCHASAWDVHFNNDLRLKMCVKIDQEDLITLHHELGHHYYFMSYHTLPIILQEGANDGFHEGIGDTLALSVTPDYLHKRGVLSERAEHPDALLNQQMRMGLEKLAFLPFGLLVDTWRWRVFSGDATPNDYNTLWWKLREELQGVRAPSDRSAPTYFDAGAKYHVPGHTPYMRYFIAHILQFQLHKALCEAAGHTGPLHTCSIYGSREAGARLKAMLSLGASAPWPDALEAVTGTRALDARPLLEYFEPLRAYLEAQNADRSCK